MTEKGQRSGGVIKDRIRTERIRGVKNDRIRVERNGGCKVTE